MEGETPLDAFLDSVESRPEKLWESDIHKRQAPAQEQREF